MSTIRVWKMRAYPGADAQLSDEQFELVEESAPACPDGGILLAPRFISVDPYLRARFNRTNYFEPFRMGEPFSSTGVSEVLESRHPRFAAGDFVSGSIVWAERFATTDVSFLSKVDPAEAPLSYNCGILGITGLSAYFPTIDIAKPKAGEIAYVSGAAGAVGSVVGQILKAFGCVVIGSAGSDDKVAWLRELGFDHAFNYKQREVGEFLDEVAPGGVDIYWDNVGGPTLDALLLRLRRFGRVVCCGSISQYNTPAAEQYGVKNAFCIVTKSLLLQGFLLRDYLPRFGEGRAQLLAWLREGKVQSRETVVEGFESVPRALMGIFKGENTGKMVVKV